MNLNHGKLGAQSKVQSYELLERIGEGGMAEVYLCIKHGLSGIRNFYAIKITKQAHAQDERFSRMFLDEARVMASIRHPNLVALHDVLTHDGQYLIVMEYLKGVDARQLLRSSAQERRTPLPVPIAVNIVHQACAGLHHAHTAKSIDGVALNLVHRDISPHNLFVTFEGYVKILDFGIAKSTLQHESTELGVLKGKISYLSPEQCTMSAPIDKRSDVYALGVVLYEFLTGARPFEGRSEIQILQAIIKGVAAPPTSYMPQLPKGLSDVVMRALAARPEDRYQDCEAFAEALSRCAKQQGWPLSERKLAVYMDEAQHEYKASLEARLVGLLTSASHEVEDGGEIKVSFEDTGKSRVSLGPDCIGTLQKVSGVVGCALSGQIRETFEMRALLEAAKGERLVLDLAEVNRLTSFGIRQWLTMLPELHQRFEAIYLSRVSVAMTNQIVTIPAMTKELKLLSLMAPFRCASCAHHCDVPIRAGENIPMVISCERCGAHTSRFDEDELYLSPLSSGARADEHIAKLLLELELVGAREGELTAVEKSVTASYTEIRLCGDVPAHTRWDRLLAGVEGALRVNFAPGARLDAECWQRFEHTLRQVEGVTTTIWGMPLESIEQLSARLASDERIKSVLASSACDQCGEMDHREWKIVQRDASAVCRSCGALLSISGSPAELGAQGVEPESSALDLRAAPHRAQQLKTNIIYLIVILALIAMIVFALS